MPQPGALLHPFTVSFLERGSFNPTKVDKTELQTKKQKERVPTYSKLSTGGGREMTLQRSKPKGQLKVCPGPAPRGFHGRVSFGRLGYIYRGLQARVSQRTKDRSGS